MSFTRRQFCAGAAAALWPPASRAATRPPVLIWIIAEQFRPDYFDDLWPLLGPGGFRRLIETGSYFPNCQFESAAFTSSGIATLLTGSWPSQHGVVANRWFDELTGKPHDAVAADLRAGTWFDPIVESARNRSFVIASGSGASLLAGIPSTRSFIADENGWRSADSGSPDWYRDFLSTDPASKWRGAVWMAANARPDATPLRKLEPSEWPGIYNSSPFAQAHQFSLLRETILRERIGPRAAENGGIDVVTVLLGSLGDLGVETGADSPLMRDMALHLDGQISSLLDLLDTQCGRDNYTVAFTAARGLDVRTPARRAADGEPIVNAMQRAFASALDTDRTKRNYVRAWLYPFVYLNHQSLAQAKMDIAEARRLAAATAMQAGKANGYYTADGDTSFTGPWRERFANSMSPQRSGDLMLSFPPHYADNSEVVAGGSLYNYDTRVPLLLYGPAFRPETFENTVRAIDIAPTLARVFGLDLPDSSSGRVLGDAIAPPRIAR
ncbi:MAG TPA: alkaline phosphatase family protein [Bryobacteraceae bacterium]|nr:alkaline phosphatase family protein [Bryobacteraceae bacterium]